MLLPTVLGRSAPTTPSLTDYSIASSARARGPNIDPKSLQPPRVVALIHRPQRDRGHYRPFQRLERCPDALLGYTCILTAHCDANPTTTLLRFFLPPLASAELYLMRIPEGLPETPNSNLSNVRCVVAINCTLGSVAEPFVYHFDLRKSQILPPSSHPVSICGRLLSRLSAIMRNTVTQTPSKLLLILREYHHLRM